LIALGAVLVVVALAGAFVSLVTSFGSAFVATSQAGADAVFDRLLVKWAIFAVILLGGVVALIWGVVNAVRARREPGPRAP